MAGRTPDGDTHAAPVGEVVRCGRGHPFALGEPGQDLHGARAADADLNLPTLRMVALDDVDRRALNRIGGDEQRIRFLARHDVRLDAHANLKRRVVGQGDTNAIGFGDRITHGGDLAHGSLERLRGKGIGAQQHFLTDGDAGNVLLVDLGDDLQGLGDANPEQDLAGFRDLADLAVPAQHHSIHGGGDRIILELLHENGDQRLHLAQVGRGPLVGLRRRHAASDELGDAGQLALGEVLAGLELEQLSTQLPVVEAGQYVTRSNRLAFAIAELDDAGAKKARDLGPAHRFDRPRRIDDLDRGATGRGNDRRPRARDHSATTAEAAAIAARRTTRIRRRNPDWLTCRICGQPYTSLTTSSGILAKQHVETGDAFSICAKVARQPAQIKRDSACE